MSTINKNLNIPEKEIEITAVRSRGPGGQNVNKVSTAIHLRFDILSSSLPEYYKNKLLALKDRRISKTGIIIIKSQRFRSRQKNKEEAILRLQKLIQKATIRSKIRKVTKPTTSSIEKRIQSKKKRAQIKLSRKKVDLNKNH